MTFSTTTEAKAAFKKIFNKSHTSDNKDLINESESSNISLTSQTIFAKSIPSTAASAMSQNIAASVSLQLLLDSSSDGKAYLAKILTSVPSSLSGKINPVTGSLYAVGQRVGYFVPQQFSDDFRVRLRDGATEIPPLASQDWFFDYFSGVIVSEDNLSLSDGYIDGYVYTGPLLSSIVDGYTNWFLSSNNIFNVNTGNVGIGTSSPSTLLQVKKNQNTDTRAKVTNDTHGSLATGGFSAESLDTILDLFSTNDSLVTVGARLAEQGVVSSNGNAGLLLEATVGGVSFAAGSPTSTIMTVDSSGKVGIGTGATTPVSLFSIKSTSSAGATLTFDYDKTTWAANDIVGRIDFNGNDASTNASGIRARLETIATSTTGAAAIRFLTATSGSTTLVESMRISGSANVGVGTTTPTFKLEASSSLVGLVAPLGVSNADTSGNVAATAALDFSLFGALGNSATAARITGGKDGGWGGPSTFDGYLAFSTILNNSLTEKLRIDSDGNVILATDAVYIGRAANNSITWNSSTGIPIFNATKSIFFNMDSDNNDSDTQAIYFGKNQTTGTISSSTNLLTILESGNVGIGATVPGAALEISNGSSSRDMLIVKENSTTVFKLSDGMAAPADTDQIATAGTSGSVTWRELSDVIIDRAVATSYVVEDFVGIPSGSLADNALIGNGYVLQLSGATVSGDSSFATVGNHPGVLELAVDAVSDFAGLVHDTGTAFSVQTGQRLNMVGYININTLNDGSNKINFRWGVTSDSSGDADTDGVNQAVIVYTTASANWQVGTSLGGSGAFTTSGIVVTTGWHKLELDLSSSSASFAIDGTTVSRSTTLPINRSLFVSPGMVKKKLGSSNRIVNIDMIAWALKGLTRA